MSLKDMKNIGETDKHFQDSTAYSL